MHRYVFVLSLLFFKTCFCQKNQAVLYDQPNQQGNHITISMASDLGWNSFDKKTASVCVSGLMLFYTTTNFNGIMEYVYGGENYCTNLKQAGQVSSVRYPGVLEDYKQSSITLYGSSGLSGDDIRIYEDSFTGALFQSSAIVTGGDNWTVYSGNDYTGSGACLIAPDPVGKAPCFLAKTDDIPNFGFWITSGKKGCNESVINKVYLTAFGKQGP